MVICESQLLIPEELIRPPALAAQITCPNLPRQR